MVLGEGAVGKTSWLHKMRTGEKLDMRYVATLGVEVHPIDFTWFEETSDVCLDIWDVAGQDKFAGLRKGYLIQAQGAIIVYDMMSKTIDEDVAKWRTICEEFCPNAPIIVVGNKNDLVVWGQDEEGDEGLTMSVKEDVGLIEPFKKMIDLLTSN